MLSLSLIFPITALTDYYCLFGMLVILGSGILMIIANFILGKKILNSNRLRYIIFASIIGMLLTQSALFILGDSSNLEWMSKHRDQSLSGRYGTHWGYGGGYGGGFHVADILTFFIPPKDDDKSKPRYLTCGPTAIAAKIGFLKTSNDMQNGQYEGFTYIGTISLVLLLSMIIEKIFQLAKIRPYDFIKWRLRLAAIAFKKMDLFSFPAMAGISCFTLYTLSWGYIIHIYGERFNNIVTPSLLLSQYWPQFMFARRTGILALPLMLFIVIIIIIWLGRRIDRYLENRSKMRSYFVYMLLFFLMGAHISEVWGYFTPPPESGKGNQVTIECSVNDRKIIRDILRDKTAILTVPAFRDNLKWSKICYCLTLFSGTPISGATLSLGTVSPSEDWQYKHDIKRILMGRLKKLSGEYGDIAIAAPHKIAEKIVPVSDLKLLSHSLKDQDVTLLTIDRKK